MSTVLIVDSDKTACDLLSTWLSSKGYEVACAYDGMEGFKLYEKLQPQLVITEIMLPAMNGYQFIRLIREGGKANRDLCKIIVLTAVRRADSRAFCLELGAPDVLLKPFTPSQLAAALEQHHPMQTLNSL